MLRGPPVRDAGPRRGAALAGRAGPSRRGPAGRRACSPRADPSRLAAILVLEVADCVAAFEELSDAGVAFLAAPYSPPWGGHRCFAIDPDGNLIELEQPA